MSISLLNCFIFVCKLMICISIFVSIDSPHWIQENHGNEYYGVRLHCIDYGYSCHRLDNMGRIIWFFYTITLINVILELVNTLLLCKRIRTRINLVLEEIGILITIGFIIATTILNIVIFTVVIKTNTDQKMDWAFFIYILSLILASIEIICSLIRVVSFCRNNSFRSSVITYTSTNNHETVHIQT